MIILWEGLEILGIQLELQLLLVQILRAARPEEVLPPVQAVEGQGKITEAGPNMEGHLPSNRVAVFSESLSKA